jgi:hypothetical protein
VGAAPIASCPIHNVKQRSLLRSRARCSAGFFFASLRRMGWSPAKPIAGPTAGTESHEFRAKRSTHPTTFVASVSSFPGHSCPGSSFLLSFRSPDRGDGGAPGGGILSPVAPVTTRHHVCEAWAVPRNRDGASRRSTVTVLGPLRARLRSCLRPVRAGDPCCRHRFRSSKGLEPPGHGLRAAAGTPPPAPPSGNASRKRPSMSGILGI